MSIIHISTINLKLSFNILIVEHLFRIVKWRLTFMAAWLKYLWFSPIMFCIAFNLRFLTLTRRFFRSCRMRSTFHRRSGSGCRDNRWSKAASSRHRPNRWRNVCGCWLRIWSAMRRRSDTVKSGSSLCWLWNEIDCTSNFGMRQKT